MKTRIYSALFCAALAAGISGGMAAAQDTNNAAPPPPPQDGGQMAAGQRTPPSPDKQAAHMAKALGLSADQQSQLQPILADRDQKVQALMQNQSLSPRDRHVQMKGIAQDTDSKINAILTDDQKQKYEAMKENRREKMMARRQANQATQPGQAAPPQGAPGGGGSNPAPPQ